MACNAVMLSAFIPFLFWRLCLCDQYFLAFAFPHKIVKFISGENETYIITFIMFVDIISRLEHEASYIFVHKLNKD